VTSENDKSTYRAELIQRIEQLNGQVNGICVDVGVECIQILGCLCYDVEGLDVVRLLPEVILTSKEEIFRSFISKQNLT
jgi:hypothetical protein